MNKLNQNIDAYFKNPRPASNSEPSGKNAASISLTESRQFVPRNLGTSRGDVKQVAGPNSRGVPKFLTSPGPVRSGMHRSGERSDPWLIADR